MNSIDRHPYSSCRLVAGNQALSVEGAGAGPGCPLPDGPPGCSLVQAARDGIVLLDEHRRILSLNPAARRTFGAGEGVLAGRPFASLISTPLAEPFDWRGLSTPTRAGASRQRSPDGCRGRRADGTEFPLDFEIACIASHPDAGRCLRFAVYVRDLSEASVLEAQIQRAEQRLRTLVELSPMAIWIAQHDRLIFANRAAALLLGGDTGADLVGRSIYALLGEEAHPALRQQLAHALAHEGQLGKVHGQLLRDNGEHREVEIALAALPDHGQTTVQMVVSDVSQRNRELREIQRSRQLLKRLSANLVEAREEERRRIARELHDELGQALSALKMDIVDCARASDLPADSGRVTTLMTRLDDIMTAVRRIATDLRPMMLDDLGLGDALESLTNDFARRMGLRVRLHLDAIDSALDERLSTAIYRMVQEALTNVARHADATEVHIDLRHDDTELVLGVRDNGVGLPTADPSSHDGQFGLLGIQERAQALGGRLEIDSPPEGGVQLVVRLPAGEHGRERGARGRVSRTRAQ